MIRFNKQLVCVSNCLILGWRFTYYTVLSTYHLYLSCYDCDWCAKFNTSTILKLNVLYKKGAEWILSFILNLFFFIYCHIYINLIQLNCLRKYVDFFVPINIYCTQKIDWLCLSASFGLYNCVYIKIWIE